MLRTEQGAWFSFLLCPYRRNKDFNRKGSDVFQNHNIIHAVLVRYDLGYKLREIPEGRF
jgi:hypothetical protein